MKVLVTEDSSLIQSIYQAVLSQIENIEIDFADSPESSRSQYQTKHYDLVFFDVDLGDACVDGCDLSTEFKNINPRAQVFMATTHDESTFLDWCHDLGFMAISKSENFVSDIRRACSERISASV